MSLQQVLTASEHVAPEVLTSVTQKNKTAHERNSASPFRVELSFSRMLIVTLQPFPYQSEKQHMVDGAVWSRVPPGHRGITLECQQ